MSLRTRKNDEKDFVLKRFTNIEVCQSEVFKTAGNHPFNVIFDLKETQLFFLSPLYTLFNASTGPNLEVISVVWFFNISNLRRLVAPPWLVPMGSLRVFDTLELRRMTYLNIWIHESVFRSLFATNNLSNNNREIKDSWSFLGTFFGRPDH